MRRWLGVLAIALLAIGCAGKKRVLPPDKLWSEANHAFDDEAYELAADRYKALLDQYPFDANAEDAELKLAQSYYLSERYAEAIAAFGDFERMHPTSANLAQVEYQVLPTLVSNNYLADISKYDANLKGDFPAGNWNQVTLGSNALALYAASVLLFAFLLKPWQAALVRPLAAAGGATFAALAYAAGTVLVAWVLAEWLYWRRVFVKV